MKICVPKIFGFLFERDAVLEVFKFNFGALKIKRYEKKKKRSATNTRAFSNNVNYGLWILAC